MPSIPFPDVPPYPGVPALVRSADIPATINLTLGLAQSLLAAALQNGDQWGIFDQFGNQLGGSGQSNGLFQSVVSGLFGSSDPILSTNAFEYTKETRISDFPVEEGGFASYNKVEMPGNPIVTLAFSGNATARTTFLNQINAACLSTDLYSVVTPEITYYNYSIERYNYQRRAERGASLLILEISLKEIRQVSAAYSTVQTPIDQPQNPAAVPQSNSGIVQPATPPPSVLKQIFNLWPSLSGGA